MTTNNNSTKKKERVLPYFITKFPRFLQKNFKKEVNSIWDDLQVELLDACKPGAADYDKFMSLAPKLEVFTSIYSPSEEQKEMLASILVRFLFEEKTTNMNKILIMKQINSILGRRVFKNLKLNWRVVYNFLDITIFTPSSSLQYASGFSEKLVEKLSKYIKKLRILYPEEALNEVITLMKQNVQPFFSSVSRGLCFLLLFFHTSTKFSAKYYEKLMPELFEFWSWKNSSIWDKAFLSVFAKLAREHPEIDWSPHYNLFFSTFLKLIKNEFPKKTAGHIENVLEIATKFLSFYPKDNLTVYISELLVKMMRPKTFSYSQEYWENFDRIFRATLPFLHPEHQGKWTRSLSQFYNNFCKFYIKRHFREQKALKAMKELEAKDIVKVKTPHEAEGTNLYEISTTNIPESDKKALESVQANSRTLDDLDKAIKQIEEEEKGEQKLDEELLEEEIEKVNDLGSLIEIGGEEETKGNAEGDEYDQLEETDTEDEDEGDEKGSVDQEESQEIDKSHENEEKKKIDKTVYFLDDSCHEKFTEMMSYVIKNLLYSRDDEVTGFVAKICRRLLLYKPDMFAPLILDMMFKSFEQSDLSYFGFIKVFTLISYPLFSRCNYKPGLYQLPKILEVTLDHLTSHDHRKTIILLEFYEAIFELVPIYHPEDLKKTYEQFYGKSDEKAIKNALNQDEETDLWKLTEDLSDWAVMFFRRFIEILPLLEKTGDVHATKVRSVMIIYRKFHSFFCQSSPRLLEKYTDILCNYLEDTMQKFPSKYLTEIIHPLNLAASHLVTKKIIPLMKKKLLYELSKPKSEEYSKKPLYHLIQKSSVGSIFDKYDLAITNKDSLLWALNIIDDLVTYSSPAILDHTDDLELMIYHILLHDEHVVFEKSIQIVQKLLLSMLSVYPTNLGSLNPSDLTKEEFLNFYKKVGRPIKKDIELNWHVPNKQEIAYTMKLFNLLYEGNIAWLTEKYLNNIQAKELTFDVIASLIDDMHLKRVETVRSERLEIGRSLIVAYNIFLGISQRVPYSGIANLSEMKKKFEDSFCFPEFINVRGNLCKFISRFLHFACPTSYVADSFIAKALIDLLASAFGEDEHNMYMLNIKKFLKKYRKAFEIRDSKELYDNRYLLSIHIDLELQKKILGYHFSLDYLKKIFDVPFILWIFTFHPDGSVSDLSFSLIDKFTIFLQHPNKAQIMSKLADYTSKLVGERFKFINENNKELEEATVIKFNNNEIVKTNRDTYIDLLMHGISRNLEYLYPFLSLHLESLFPIINSFMQNPKMDDTYSLTTFYRIIKCIDLSPHPIPNQRKNQKDTKDKKPLILKSNKYYKNFEEKLQNLHYEPKNFYNMSHALPQTEIQMEKIIQELGQESIHWKHQVLGASLGMVMCRYFDPTSDLYIRFILKVFDQISSSHSYLRLFAISAFPILMKAIPKKSQYKKFIEKTPQDFEGLKLTLDEAFKRHFILKSDYEKYYLKDPYSAYIEFYDRLEVNDLNPELAVELPQDFVKEVQQKEFFQKLFTTMLTDVPTRDDTGGGSKTAFNFKNVIKHFFGKESKLKHNLPIASGFSLTSASFLGSIFKYLGGVIIFKNSFDIIQEYAKDYDSREKQVYFLTAHYLYAVLKNFMYWDKQYQDEIMTKMSDFFVDAIENLSYENLLTWIFGFINATVRTDYRLLKPFMDRVFKNCSEKKNPGILVRYLSLHGIIVKYNGHLSDDIAEKLLDYLLEFKPTDIRQATEVCQNSLILLKYYVLAPVNYKKLKEQNIVENIDAIIEQNPDKYYVENGCMLYSFNKKFIQVTNQLIEAIKGDASPSDKKNYFEVFFNMLTIFYSERLSYAAYIHFEHIIQFLIELNNDDGLSLSAETIQSHSHYLALLSKLSYPEKVIPKILEIVQNCLNSSNYRVRENALKFYHYFHFNHIYYLKDKSINMVENSLLDENPVVRNMAFDVLVDLFKIYTKEELLREIEKIKRIVQEAKKAKDKNDELCKGLYVMMTILLSHPYEIEEWMEELLVILLQTKKPRLVNERFNKDFVVRFRDDHKGIVNINQRELSYEVYSDLREISNPSSYFA